MATVYGYVNAPEPTGKVYFIRDGAGNIKIGVSTDVTKRKFSLQTACANELETFCVWKVQSIEDAYEIEGYLHDKFDAIRKRGEWFAEDEVIAYLRHGDLDVPGYRFENIDW